MLVSPEETVKVVKQVISPIRAPTQTTMHASSSPVLLLQSVQLPKEETEEQVSQEKVEPPHSESGKQPGMSIAGTVPRPLPSFFSAFSDQGAAERVL